MYFHWSLIRFHASLSYPTEEAVKNQEHVLIIVKNDGDLNMGGGGILSLYIGGWTF